MRYLKLFENHRDINELIPSDEEFREIIKSRLLSKELLAKCNYYNIPLLSSDRISINRYPSNDQESIEILLLSSNDNCTIRIDFDISISKFTRKNYSWILLQVNSMLNVEGYNINLSYDKEFREEYKTINKEDFLSLFIDVNIKLNNLFMTLDIS
jgi:hypothetical protein